MTAPSSPRRTAGRAILRLLLRLEALAHELLALIPVEIPSRRLLIAGLHLLALRVVVGVRLRGLRPLVAVLGVGARRRLEALGHELPALVAGQVAILRLRIALRHLLRLGRGCGGVLLVVRRGRGAGGEQE